MRDLNVYLFNCCRPHHAVAGRFSGAYYLDPLTGDIIVAAQTVPASTAITAPLIFTDSNGATVKGPIGALSSTDTTVSPSLSADGQAVNLTTPPAGTFTVTWHDPDGKVPDFSVDLTDLPLVTVSGAFGTFTAGTTP